MQFSSMSSLGSSMRRWKSSMFSNTTARARCVTSFGVAAEGLMMAPSGQRLPRSTAMPASFLNGDLKPWITSRFQHGATWLFSQRSEEHTSELQSLAYLVCRLLLEKKKKKKIYSAL